MAGYDAAWSGAESASVLAARQLAEEARQQRHHPRRRPPRRRPLGRPGLGECAALVVTASGHAGAGSRY
ncbi:hypothetical protein [Modestobacter sp. KNN46-3]|jgi:hypothetical protein|uniref:hypothetical protein n=1 Tax=Modestobacter sp. KNN46-3 TaxID=2711218 RepID=UPI0013DE808B|nr:hypothetical protein [Modestobacter sp. KNN46-3]